MGFAPDCCRDRSCRTHPRVLQYHVQPVHKAQLADTPLAFAMLPLQDKACPFTKLGGHSTICNLIHGCRQDGEKLELPSGSRLP